MSKASSETPTPQRRQRAREQGHVARSHELASAMVTLGAIGGLVLCGPSLMQSLLELLRLQLQDPSIDQAAHVHIQQVQQIGLRMLVQVAQPLAIVAAVACLAHLAQTGLLWLPEKLAPDLRRVDPRLGFGRIVHPDALVRILFQTLKLIVFLSVGAGLLWSRLPDFMALANGHTTQLLRDGASLLARLALTLGCVLLAFGILDYVYQKWKYERQLQLPEDDRDDVRAIHNDVSFARSRRMLDGYPRQESRLDRHVAENERAAVKVTSARHHAPQS